MVVQIYVQVIWVDSMGHVCRNHKTVRVRLAEQVGTAFVPSECFTDTLNGAGQEVTARSLAEEGAYFLVVEKANELDNAAVVRGVSTAGAYGRSSGRRKKGFDCRKGA